MVENAGNVDDAPTGNQATAGDVAENIENELDKAEQATNDLLDDGAVNVQEPGFQSLQDSPSGGKSNPSLINEIAIELKAELGRTHVSIEDLMSYSVGSVILLDQEIGSLVNVVAQGVTLAAGEVVVVDGNFAIRIVEIFEKG